MVSYIVYTALLGGYDDLPNLSVHDDKIRYICFTDSDHEENPIWEMVPIESYFRDRKITNGFLKSNSHEIFGTDVISLWVDGNLRDLKITTDVLDDMVRTSPVATFPHLVRSTISEEMDAVARVGLEHPSVVQRWRRRLAEVGFPDGQRLAATPMVARDHRNSALRRANRTWWKLISSGIRRDQLSFNYALWENGVQQAYIDADWRVPNRLFTRVGHKNEAGRVLNPDMKASLLLHGSILDMPEGPAAYPKDISYTIEGSTELELKVQRELNRTVHLATGDGKVEGNYCHFHEKSIREFTPPDARRSWKREYLRRAVQGCRNGLEVGFNAGHSAAIMLEAEPLLRLTSVDICSHVYTRPCSQTLQSSYSERFQFIPGRSDSVLGGIDGGQFDFVHIDGGHDLESVKFDLGWFCDNAARGCRLLVDDAYVPRIANGLAERVGTGTLRPVHVGLPSSGENRLFVKT